MWMYTPPFNAVHDEATVREMVVAYRTAWLVTADEQGLPAATLLPIIWRADTVIAHMAKGNAHWRGIANDAPGLLIATGPDAYISPAWYAAKTEHGKVVPTWNYTAVQLTGTVRVHQDAEWLRAAVTDLTELHESGRTHPWHVTDAPEQYIHGQLRGIVGIEFTVTRVDGKAKLSQNRSDADQDGVIEGLRNDQLPAHSAAGAHAIANAMTDARTTGHR
jgi:transcriptional regulator